VGQQQSRVDPTNLPKKFLDSSKIFQGKGKEREIERSRAGWAEPASQPTGRAAEKKRKPSDCYVRLPLK